MRLRQIFIYKFNIIYNKNGNNNNFNKIYINERNNKKLL